MPEEKNVGQLDSIIRIILGLVCLGLFLFHFLGGPKIPVFELIALVILIPYFLKTGLTKVCPVMKFMNISTIKKQN